MDIYKMLVTKGYIPKEIPPLISSDTLGVLVDDISIDISQFKPHSSKSSVFDIPKSKNFTRSVHIPNPLHYMNLAKSISDNWKEIDGMLKISQNSLTKPTFCFEDERAFKHSHSFDNLIDQKAHLACSNKFVLYTDISRFFKSIYTHSIPWAIYGKKAAKQNKSNSMYGNLLDTLVRNTQDKQTMGIPTGPDTSFILSELILTSLDIKLNEEINNLNYIRYIDDFYFYVKERSEAESILTKLTYILKDYELELNDSKTKILELPQPLEPLWQQKLKTFRIRSTENEQRSDLKHFFSLSFEYFNTYKTNNVLFYTISHIALIKILEDNWAIYESLLLQALTVETSLLPLVGKILITYKTLGYTLDNNKIKDSLKNIVILHSKTNNNYAISWSIWITELLNIKLDIPEEVIMAFKDPISILMTLHTNEKGLLDCKIPKTTWQSMMKSDELYGSHWIVSYEAFQRGWMKNRNGSDYISKDPFFSKLREKGCSFIDDSIVIEPFTGEELQDEQNLDLDVEPFCFFY